MINFLYYFLPAFLSFLYYIGVYYYMLPPDMLHYVLVQFTIYVYFIWFIFVIHIVYLLYPLLLSLFRRHIR